MIDRFEEAASSFPAAELPLVHRFTPGLYTRQITMPAGSAVVSREHKTEHPFFISKGKVAVVSENEGRVVYEAPYSGVTTPGTRRILLVMEETIWTTVHANPENETDPDKIVEDVTVESSNPLIDVKDPRYNAWRADQSPSQIEISESIQKKELNL